MSKQKHKLVGNLNMSLDSIGCDLRINECLDCKSGAIAYTLSLVSAELGFDIKLENNYSLNGNKETKYYRNRKLLKHILNGKVAINETIDDELVTVTRVETNHTIKSLTIIALNFADINEKLMNERMSAPNELLAANEVTDNSDNTSEASMAKKRSLRRLTAKLEETPKPPQSQSVGQALKHLGSDIMDGMLADNTKIGDKKRDSKDFF